MLLLYQRTVRCINQTTGLERLLSLLIGVLLGFLPDGVSRVAVSQANLCNPGMLAVLIHSCVSFVKLLAWAV